MDSGDDAGLPAAAKVPEVIDVVDSLDLVAATLQQLPEGLPVVPAGVPWIEGAGSKRIQRQIRRPERLRCREEQEPAGFQSLLAALEEVGRPPQVLNQLAGDDGVESFPVRDPLRIKMSRLVAEV